MDANCVHFPAGSTRGAPQVRDWLLLREDRLVGLGSWCLSYGRERAQRPTALKAYYVDAWLNIGEGDDEARMLKRIEVVLTERLRHYAKPMLSAHQLEPVGLDESSMKSDFYGRLSQKAPSLYVVGPEPLKVRKWGTKSQLETYDPNRVDWVVRGNFATTHMVDLLNAKRPSVADCKTLMVEAIKVIARNEHPSVLDADLNR